MNTITLHGDIDIYNVNKLKEELEKCTGGEILIDASDLSYIDSTGLGVLVSTLNRIRQQDGSIRICGLKPHIYKIFELTGLHEIFDIEVAK